jgi:NADPH:quinone reductase-like Zn-dependent oxidoreductase
MRAFEIQEFGIDNLKLVERDAAQPGPFEVVVRLKAASLNFRDLMVTEGTYNPRLKRPMVPFSDGAGIVEAVGERVTRVKVGDRVAGIFMQKWLDGAVNRAASQSALGGAIDGVLSEQRIFHEDGLVHIPEHLSFIEAATLPCAAVTAWHALFEEAPAKAGDSVVIQGTGGVACFALQFAKAAGMRAIVLSSSDEKLKRAQELGAAHVINYKKEPNWEKSVLAIVPGGADYVIQVAGDDALSRSLKAVRMGGQISVIGVLTGAASNIDPRLVLMNSIRLQGIYVGSRAMFERMNRAIELHRISPLVDRVFSWLEAPQAMRYMQEQGHLGKIALEF